MEQLIWYSIPGALVMFGIGLVIPELSKDSFVALAIGGTPVAGFIIHQSWRAIFETVWGYDNRNRRVIREIVKRFPLDNKTAFLVWELTLYSDVVHESFREHDRGVWHYVMSFCATALAAFVGIGIIHCLPSSSYPIAHLCGWTWFFLLIGVVFIWKAWLSTKSIGNQESGLVSKLDSKFKETARSLGVKV
jgi:hypothetical protein